MDIRFKHCYLFSQNNIVCKSVNLQYGVSNEQFTTYIGSFFSSVYANIPNILAPTFILLAQRVILSGQEIRLISQSMCSYQRVNNFWMWSVRCAAVMLLYALWL